jgi:cell wall-associated NlpC family hydrolase
MTTPTEKRAKIVTAAVSCLGIPYLYGGEGPPGGLDCSRLSQWCCAEAGIVIPRGSAAQFTASGPRFAENPPPGCLAFFYGGETSGPRPGHVGIVVAPGRMIDAPYTGVRVRYDNFLDKATIGPMDFYGFTDPAAMTVAPAPRPVLTLTHPYMTGQAVLRLQAALNKYGYTPLVVDGIFGPLTEAAVKAFQKSHLLTADGIVGILTWAKLLNTSWSILMSGNPSNFRVVGEA